MLKAGRPILLVETLKLKIMRKVKLFGLMFILISTSLGNPVCVFGQQSSFEFQKQSTEVKIQDLQTANNENYLNTVTTKDTDGKTYKLVIIGDLLPKFYVSGNLISRSELAQYSSVIEKMTPVLWQRQKQADEEKNALFEKNIKAIVDELIQKGVFKNAADIRSIRLTENVFMVNDINLSFEVFSYFKKKYIKSSDEEFYFNKQ
jgi:hypothetical protein